MAFNAGTLEALLKLKDEATPALKAAQATVKATAKTFDQFTAGLGPVGKGLAALGPYGTAAAAGITAASAAVTIVGKQLADATVEAVKFGAEFQDLSDNTGVAAESLQAIASSSGIGTDGMEAFAGGLKKLNAELVKSPEQFDQLGLSAGRLLAMRPEERFAAVADSLSRLSSDAERSAAAQELLGKAFPLKTLSDFAGIQDKMARSRNLGLTIDNETTAKLKALSDEADVLSDAWSKLWINLGSSIASTPGVLEGLTGLTNGVGEFNRFLQQSKGDIQALASLAVPAFGAIAGQVHEGINELRMLQGIAATATGGVKSLFGSGSQTAAPMAFHGGSIANTPTGTAPSWDPKKLEEAAAAAKKLASEVAALAKEFSGATVSGKELSTIEAALVKIGGASHVAESQVDKLGKSLLEASLNGQKLGTESAKIAQAFQDKHGFGALADVKTRNLGVLAAPSQDVKQATEFVFDYVDATTEAVVETIDWSQRLADVANAAQALGPSFAGVAQVIGGISNAMASLKSISFKGGITGGKGLEGLLGNVTGIMGMLGSAVSIGKAIGGLFQNKEVMKVNDMRDAFFEAHGGFLQLQKDLAGLTNQDMVKKIFDAKTVEQFNAAVNETMGLLDSQTKAQEALDAAVEKYGFTIDELGPKFQQQKLDEMAGQLIQDYRLLTASGIDASTVIKRMGPDFINLVNAARSAGAALPETMRPMIDALIASGQLVDENGQAFASAEAAGISFTETITEGLSRMIDAIDRLVQALTGVGGAASSINIPTAADIGLGGGPGDRGGRFPEGFAGGSHGFRDFGAGTHVILHGREAVVPAGESVGNFTVGDISVQVNIPAGAQLDPEAVGQACVVALRNNLGSLRQTVRGL